MKSIKKNNKFKKGGSITSLNIDLIGKRIGNINYDKKKSFKDKNYSLSSLQKGGKKNRHTKNRNNKNKNKKK